MTSQRDETVGHRTGDEIEDDPIVVERHDEILGGPPAEDRAADDAPARDELATDQMASGGRASDELARPGTRHRGQAVRGWTRTRRLWWCPQSLLRLMTRRLLAGRQRLALRPPRRSPGCP